MLKVICLSVLLYIACLSNIVDGRQLNKLDQKATLLENAQNNIRSLLSTDIGHEFTINGETYVIDSALGIVPENEPAYKYYQYWDNAEFLHSAFLQLQFVVKQVDDVNDVKPVPTAETYVYSDKTFIAKGGFGKVYGATKYRSNGSKSTTRPYVLKLVATLADAQKECAEYSGVPRGPNFIRCYGTATYDGKGFALLDDAGPDLDKILAKNGPIPEVDRKKIVKGLMSALKVLFTLHKVHRDLKPNNVCYKNGVVKLIDFGLMYDWGTEATVEKIDRLSRRGFHATPFYKWPALKEELRYKSGDKLTDQTKLAYVTKMKQKLYLVDVGGVFVTHFKMIKPYTTAIGTDVFSYFEVKAASKSAIRRRDFWTRKNISADEKAVLYALKDMTKSIDDILGMAWLA